MDLLQTTELEEEEGNLNTSICCGTPSIWMLNKLLFGLELERAQRDLDECESTKGE
jgi:hypothetical protein